MDSLYAQVGIILNADMVYPLNKGNARDVAAAERALEFTLGWFAGTYNDIFLPGNR